METIDTLDIGHARMMQYPGGGDDDVDHIARSAGGGGDVPSPPDMAATRYLGVEAYVLAQPVTIGDRLEVTLNLAAARRLQSGLGAKL
ncbi:MAG TPA: hypothetical protein VL993_02965 [Stellaceae bacterium]|nr:hypothetical protein [Stellaceae bacterium]